MHARLFPSSLTFLAALLPIGCSTLSSTGAPSIVGTQAYAAAPAVLRPAVSARWIDVTDDAISPGTSRRLLEFDGNSSGDAAPIRVLNTGEAAFAVESDASFWSGPFWSTTYQIKNRAAGGSLLGSIGDRPGIASATVDAAGNVYTLEGDESYGTGCDFENPVIKEYAAKSYGKTALRSFVPSPGPYPIGCNSIVSVDSSGDVYVATNVVTAGQWAGAQIREYAPSSAGRATRSIVFKPSGAATTIGAVQGASNGAVYALLNSDLVIYAAGSKTPALVRTNVVTFALDSHDTIYAIVKHGTSYALDVLRPPGAVVREVSGTQTGLRNPVAIAVSP